LVKALGTVAVLDYDDDRFEIRPDGSLIWLRSETKGR
jgi:predicted Rdx family selenoprotein